MPVDSPRIALGRRLEARRDEARQQGGIGLADDEIDPVAAVSADREIELACAALARERDEQRPFRAAHIAGEAARQGHAGQLASGGGANPPLGALALTIVEI